MRSQDISGLLRSRSTGDWPAQPQSNSELAIARSHRIDARSVPNRVIADARVTGPQSIWGSKKVQARDYAGEEAVRRRLIASKTTGRALCRRRNASLVCLDRHGQVPSKNIQRRVRPRAELSPAWYRDCRSHYCSRTRSDWCSNKPARPV